MIDACPPSPLSRVSRFNESFKGKAYRFEKEERKRRAGIPSNSNPFFFSRPVNQCDSVCPVREADRHGAGRGLRIRSWKNAGGQAVTTNWGPAMVTNSSHPGHPRLDLSSRVHRRSPADPIYRPSPLRSLGDASNSGIICPPCVSSSPSVSPLIRITSPPLSTSLSFQQGTGGRYDPSLDCIATSYRPPPLSSLLVTRTEVALRDPR